MCWARSRSRSGCCAVSTASSASTSACRPPAVGLDSLLERRQPTLLQALHLASNCRLVGEIGQAAPQLERLAQQRRGEIRIPLEQRGVSATHQPVKELQIEFAVGDAQRVPMPLRDESAVP